MVFVTEISLGVELETMLLLHGWWLWWWWVVGNLQKTAKVMDLVMYIHWFWTSSCCADELCFLEIDASAW